MPARLVRERSSYRKWKGELNLLEAPALIWALQNFEVYIFPSVPVTIYTDHNHRLLCFTVVTM
jgi:hypothetical protein